MSKELIEETEEAIKTEEFNFSICLYGGKVINGQRLVERLLAALKERETIDIELDSLDFEQMTATFKVPDIRWTGGIYKLVLPPAPEGE